MNVSEIIFLLLKCTALLVLFAAAMTFFKSRNKDKGKVALGGSHRTDVSIAPAAPRMNVRFQSARNLRFQWRDVAGASHYQLLERVNEQTDFKRVGSYILPGRESLIWTVPLHSRINAQYILRAYNEDGFTDSSMVSITAELEDSLRFLRTSEIDASEFFGFAINLNEGGNTLIIAQDDFSSAYPRVHGKTAASYMGAAYVFNRDRSGQWSQTAYINALAKADCLEDDSTPPPQRPSSDRAAESGDDESAQPSRYNDAPESFFRQLGWKS
ncbi:hypothetical protein [Saccharospirillum mangrovi]|uniref:hypothetical protein n=1 Tax=Saccharospirillum mangrovi TaxID=2161747 RepID=UPI000D38E00E|nr:hypothetical protein [Saccharospirillum mangrovi]